MKQINVMLVDDHAVVRLGFRMLLEASGDIRVTGEAGSGEEALRAIDAARPDIVVLDLALPGMGGLEVLDRALAKHSELKILVLSAFEDVNHPRRALKAGARGYLSKRSAADELIAAIRAVAEGDIYLEPAIAKKLALGELSQSGDPLDILTPKEFQVFMAMARGQSVNDIAQTMHLSPRTIGTHLYHLKQKLGAANQAQITMIAMRNGLIAS